MKKSNVLPSPNLNPPTLCTKRKKHFYKWFFRNQINLYWWHVLAAGTPNLILLVQRLLTEGSWPWSRLRVDPSSAKSLSTSGLWGSTRVTRPWTARVTTVIGQSYKGWSLGRKRFSRQPAVLISLHWPCSISNAHSRKSKTIPNHSEDWIEAIKYMWGRLEFKRKHNNTQPPSC